MTLQVEWHDRDARRIVALLDEIVGGGAASGPEARSRRFRLVGGTLVVSASDEDGRLDLDLTGGSGTGSEASDDTAGDTWPLGIELAAVAFATVDTERAARSTGGTQPETLPRDPLLGASAVSLPLDGAPGVRLLLLEPDTESLLVAALARTGESLRALWLRLPADRFAALPGLVRDRTQLRGPSLGPLGAEWILVPARRWGPYLLLVGAAAGTAHPLPDTPYRSR